MHQENKIITHEAPAEDAGLLHLLASKLRCLPGRVAVLMDPVPETFAGTDILMPEGKYKGKYRPDTGTVISGELPLGERVGVRPYDGLWLKTEDFDWIPDGRELRLYGVADDWKESVICTFN